MKLNTAFLDLFLTLLFCFIILWVLALVLISEQKTEDSAPKLDSKFTIITKWEASLDCDVDLWAQRQGNLNSLTGFSRRENDVFILHNDNTSSNYGAVDEQVLEEATETLTIEQIKEDQYHISLHGFRIPVESVQVSVKVFRNKPFMLICEKTVDVFPKTETPVCSFFVNQDGSVSNIINNDLLLKYILEDR